VFSTAGFLRRLLYKLAPVDGFALNTGEQRLNHCVLFCFLGAEVISDSLLRAEYVDFLNQHLEGTNKISSCTLKKTTMQGPQSEEIVRSNSSSTIYHTQRN
jgi:hypothetical protein